MKKMENEFEFDWDALNKVATNHARHPVKNKQEMITDTVHMHEHYLHLAFIQGAEWAKEQFKKYKDAAERTDNKA